MSRRGKGSRRRRRGRISRGIMRNRRRVRRSRMVVFRWGPMDSFLVLGVEEGKVGGLVEMS